MSAKIQKDEDSSPIENVIREELDLDFVKEHLKDLKAAFDSFQRLVTMDNKSLVVPSSGGSDGPDLGLSRRSRVSFKRKVAKKSIRNNGGGKSKQSVGGEFRQKIEDMVENILEQSEPDTYQGPCKLVVSNLGPDVEDKDLIDLCKLEADSEDEIQVTVNYNAEGKSSGTAEIKLSSTLLAERIFDRFQGRDLDNRPMEFESVVPLAPSNMWGERLEPVKKLWDFAKTVEVKDKDLKKESKVESDTGSMDGNVSDETSAAGGDFKFATPAKI